LKKSRRLADEILQKNVKRKVLSHAVLHFHSSRPTDDDGATLPL
jgi:hypothetical protein